MFLRGFLAFSLILSTALFATTAYAAGDAKKGKKGIQQVQILPHSKIR